MSAGTAGCRAWAPTHSDLSSIPPAPSQDSGLYLKELIEPVLTCFNDADSRLRYYACEALYNIVKVARGAVLPHFNVLFDGLSKVTALLLLLAGLRLVHPLHLTFWNTGPLFPDAGRGNKHVAARDTYCLLNLIIFNGFAFIPFFISLLIHFDGI